MKESTTITGSKVGITVAVMCAALMALLDISIVNVALSDIRASFGTPMDQIGWVSTGYMMANVVVIPMTGFLQRRFGYKRYFAASILIFTAASLLCGLAWNLPSLVAARVLQGIGGGAIIPTAQSILFARYPREEHSMAGGLFGLGAVTGPLLGPAVGGWLIDVSNWHWIFLVNLPVGLLAAGLAWRYIEEPGYVQVNERIDAFGIGLLAVGMPTLQYVLEEGNREGWDSTQVRVIGAIAVIALVTFIVHELETDSPVVDLRVFKNRSYTAGTGINFLLGIALFAGSYLFSLYCGAVMHYTALDIGKIFLVAGVVQIVMMPLLGKFSGGLDGRPLVAFGIATACLSLWMNGHLTSQASFWDLAKPQMVRSFAMGFIFIPLSVIALSDLPPAQRGNATGLFNLTRELGGSIGTAWMGMALDDSTKVFRSRLVESVTLYNPAAMEQLGALRGGVARLPDPSATATQILDLRVQIQALIKAFNEGFLTVAALFAAGLFLVFLLKRPQPGVKIEGAH
ncbi:Drug resistance transporter EmrB/QacA subfamily protein [Minicystis rosea]|nr:Drug resistance transporter EmrB/QacA subfamily protein [Minicystis rosea]